MRDMADAASSADGALVGVRLLRELVEINGEVDADALEMERLTRLTALPEGQALSSARLRFSRGLRRHLQHIDGPVLSHLRTTVAADAIPAIDAFRRLLHGYHEAAAHHVAHWPSTSVTSDWDGYRRSVGEMLASLRRRVEVERREIHPLLSGTRRR